MTLTTTIVDFNSIKVRLEPRPHTHNTHPYEYFNSIKVRLERVWLDADAAPIAFQFHKGTIRTSSLSCIA